MSPHDAQTARETVTITARSGLEVRVRPLRPDDKPYLVALFESLSPESRYRRFHQVVENPSPAMVERAVKQLTELNPVQDGALIAFADLPGEADVPVAVARYMGLEAGVSEMALTVRDELQRQGVGTQLLKLLFERARRQGLRRIVAYMQPDNVGMRRVLEKMPYELSQRQEDAELQIEIYLDRPRQVGLGKPS